MSFHREYNLKFNSCEFKWKKKKENKFNKILSGVINDINTNKGDEEISKWLIEMDDANG